MVPEKLLAAIFTIHIGLSPYLMGCKKLPARNLYIHIRLLAEADGA